MPTNRTPKVRVIVYDTGEYEDYRSDVVLVETRRTRKEVEATVKALNAIVSKGYESVVEANNKYFAVKEVSDGDHEKWQRSLKRIKGRYRTQMHPFIGAYSREVDVGDDGAFRVIEVPYV